MPRGCFLIPTCGYSSRVYTIVPAGPRMPPQFVHRQCLLLKVDEDLRLPVDLNSST